MSQWSVLDRLSPARLGLLFVLSGPLWVGAWAWWDSTRLWTPVFVPISLSPGHIRTPEFAINVASTYTVGVVMNIVWSSNEDYTAAAQMLGFDSSDGRPSVVGVSWRLSSAGRMLASGDSSDGELRAMFPIGRGLGKFYANKGTYVLDLDVVRDGSRLNRWAPHLVVVEDGYAHEKSDERGGRGALLLWLAPIGIILLARAAAGRRMDKHDAWMKASRLAQAGPQLQTADAPKLGAARRRVSPGATVPIQRWKITPSIQPAFTRPPWVGLVILLCLVVIDVPFWTVYLESRVVPKGLPVSLMNPAVNYQRGPGIQPVLVRLVLGGCRPGPCLSIDTQLVSWNAFDSVLQEKLNLRPPNWPVYLEGDSAMDWMYAAQVIDKIQGLHAKVVLLGKKRP